MPEFDFKNRDGENEPLFPENDPLTFTMTDIEGKRHTFKASDEGRPPDDRRYKMDSEPLTYMVEAVAGQVIDDQEAELRKLMWKLWEDRLLDAEMVKDLIEWLAEQRDKARREQAKRKLRRPTTAPSVSTPS